MEIRRSDLDFLLPNVTDLVRQTIQFVDRHFPTADQSLVDYLLIACNNPKYEALSSNVHRFCIERHLDIGDNFSDAEAFRFVRNWLLTARTLQDFATRIQTALSSIPAGEAYMQALYISRVLHDASIGSIQKVQSLLTAEIVATPYGLIEQGEARRLQADKLREQLACGNAIRVFRVVSAYGNFLQWSPFWSLGFPPSNLIETGEFAELIHQDGSQLYRLSGPLLVVCGQLRPTVQFVLEPGPRLRSGDASTDIVITTFDGVEIEHNPALMDHINALMGPAKAS